MSEIIKEEETPNEYEEVPIVDEPDEDESEEEDTWADLKWPNLNGDSTKKERGRPKGSGLDPNKTVASIRVRADTYAILESWKKRFRVDTFDDAINAYIQESKEMK